MSKPTNVASNTAAATTTTMTTDTAGDSVATGAAAFSTPSASPGSARLADAPLSAPNTLLGVAANYKEALRAVDELRSQAGLADEEISLVARHPDPPHNSLHGTPGGTPEPQDEKSIGRGIAAGGVLGGVGGLALGVGSLLIPGLGPVLATGIFASVLGGVGAGAAAGGVAGIFQEQGLPDQRARDYQDRLHQGEVLIAVHSPTPDQALVAQEILKRYEELASRPL